jgi:hypothetical protein
VQRVGRREQDNVGVGEAAGKAMRRRAVAFLQRPRPGALDQPHQLRPRVAGGAHQVAHQEPLVRPLEPGIPKPAQYAVDMPVAILVLAASPKLDLGRPFDKLPQLRQRYQPVFVHIRSPCSR